MAQESLGLSFEVNVDTSNCDDVDGTKSAIAEFIKITVAEVSGHTQQLGEVEIELEGELCDETDRRARFLRLRPSRGYIWMGGGGKYPSGCTESDDRG